MRTIQTFDNHARFFPLFHFVVAPILMLNVVWSAALLIRRPSYTAGVELLVAVGLFLLALAARLMALRVQDRVIRLEMRLRMERVLGPELRARIPEFTVDQLISLRFAGDTELPALAAKVLEDGLTSRKTIKKLVLDWQPDFLRA